MAKSLLQLEAQRLRSLGISIRNIAKELHVSRSSVSRWVLGVPLSDKQLQVLKESENKGKELGRLKSLTAKKEQRQQMLENYILQGLNTVSNLTNRELLLVGLALYWAEGGKTNRRVEFCNSDPRMIKLLTLWLEHCLGVDKENLTCRIGINQIHAQRETEVRQFWSEVMGISPENFKKTSFKKVENKKTYSNFSQHYGTLTVGVVKSAQLYYKIAGLINGLKPK